VLLERIRRIVGVQSVLYDPLPRSGGWPIVLLAAAVGMLAALRLQLPAPADVAATLAGAPARTVAALSGNPRLLEPSAPAVASPPAPAPQPVVQAPARDGATADVEKAVVAEIPIAAPARPRIVVASAAPLAPRAADIRARIASVPALPVPVAVPESPPMPVALRRVQPAYPVHEKIRGVTGRVDLQFAIDSDGSVTDVSVLQSTPEHVFDRVAINALRQWRFAAAAASGQRFTQSFAFTLDSGIPAAAEPCREVIGSHICRHMAAGEESPP
jgi:TonB family protein